VHQQGARAGRRRTQRRRLLSLDAHHGWLMLAEKTVQLESIYINRFTTGLYTQRSPLVPPVSIVGVNQIPRRDAFIDGLNVELTNAMTVIRRPGFSKYSTQALSGGEIVRSFFGFRNNSGTNRVM